MTVSGVSCRNDIGSCSQDDRAVNQALNHSLDRAGEKKAKSNVTPNGPGFVETKKEQGMGVERLVKNSEAIARSLTSLPKSVPGWVKKGVGITTEIHKATVGTARELGQELHEGNLRDAQNVAILRMAAPKLPKDYVKGELAEKSRASDYARQIETTLQARPPAAYLKLVKSVQTSAQSGIDTAKKLGVDSEAKLAKALAENADFAKAYDANTAFRHGVRSQLR